MKMTDALWANLKYFRPAEFARPEMMEFDLLEALDRARAVAGIPLVVTSSYRDPVHNAEVGGEDDSAHLRGYAVDIRAGTSRSRFHVLRGLFAAGVRRVGVYYTHIHADVDPTLVAGVTWLPKRA